MKTNEETVMYLIELIEKDLSVNYSLDYLAKTVGYSKYHLHKMFTNIVGMPLYQYLKKRRLSEAAKRLLFTNESIINIALNANYESQQSFTDAFKAVFNMSPKAFRFKMQNLSLTLKYEHTPIMKGERIMDVRIEVIDNIILAGYCLNTIKGFFTVPKLWKKLHKNKLKVKNRASKEWVIGLNDYSNSNEKDSKISFDMYACIEVSNEKSTSDMTLKTLPKSRYAIFALEANPKDSLEPVIDYIYKEWFPSTSYRLNDKARYDFVKYSEEVDNNCIGKIEVYVPIL